VTTRATTWFLPTSGAVHAQVAVPQSICEPEGM
jgi:hypothetical protein